MSGKLAQSLLGEQLGHQSGVFVDASSRAVGSGQTGAFLTPVLEGEETEEREPGGLMVW